MEAAMAHRVLPAQLTWPGVELRLLSALEAVAGAESFTGAAARLGYTQSAVSSQVAALERAVGEILVDRTPGSRKVDLTPAGRLLLRHAIAIRNHLEAARCEIESIMDGCRSPSTTVYLCSSAPPRSTASTA